MNLRILSLAIPFLLAATPTLAVELIGQIESKNKQSVVSEVNGVVESASFEPGDKVLENDLLANIKTQDFKFDISKKQASLELAQADLQLKETTFERFQELVQKKSLSANDLDGAKADYLSAKANVSLAKIALDEAKQNLIDTKITASIEGFVVTRNAEVGTWVNQGDLLYQLVNIEKLTVKLLASQHDMTELYVGQEIEIWPETDPSYKIRSTIKRIGVEMENDTLAYPIEVEISNDDFLLKPGMSIYASTNPPQTTP
ncbi:efflux RND transporter periplasmic adaptor subunit [Vibrio tubiashii]|uniref:Efflux RND transporter periplasmic adaptor subunit n=1 Tax=Vibrio tubiashii TaxID=29498 RepID=A0AAE5GM85_9VIBR|nr:efflux RND transporter periplasmic adaptor subunit [Vibrio tubiashii]NOI79389.1 efflux RND transporter periplasmic adaptor subunit [Vibrio tubiashii]